MQTKNWQQLEKIFHEALALDEASRNDYLLRACAGNPGFIDEVKSLIEAYEENPEIISQPAFELGLEILDRREPILPRNGRIGNYQIIEILGRGGMGDVFLANDLKLDRKVALKFLANYFADDDWAKKRLIREAQAAAILDHPNICGVYGLEAVNDDLFIVMQYVEGETLTQLMKKRSLSGEEIVSIIIQTAEAIATAHANGIMHRDIKPGNIIVGPDTKVKVLDFGLAKRISKPHSALSDSEQISEVTQSGLIMGTVAYMSPEQLRAEELDYRTDIFSMGVLMYELLAGTHPFARPSDAETISAVLVNEPLNLDRQNSKISIGLSKVLFTCLEKDKEKRYKDGSELLDALRQIPHEKNSHLSRRLRIAAIIVTIFVLVTFIALVFRPSSRSVAILPFQNSSGSPELDFLTDGMTEDLIIRLAGERYLKVKPFTKVSGYRDGLVDPAVAGLELGVDVVLSGELKRSGDQLVLATKLLEIPSGRSLLGKEVVVDQANLLPGQIDISKAVADKLMPFLFLGRYTTAMQPKASMSSPVAFRSYLLGRHFWQKRDEKNILQAIDYFQQAVDTDPAFAPAYAGLADSYVLLSSVAYGSMPTRDAMTKAKFAARQAIQLDPDLCESHSSMALVLMKYEWNWEKAEEEFRRSIALDPEFAPAHYWLSGLLAITGRANESIAEAEIAKSLDPFSPLSDINLSRAYYYARRYDEALSALRSSSNAGQNDAKNRYMVGLILIQKESFAEAIEVLRPIYDANNLMGGAALGFAYAKNGNRQAALEIMNELEQKSAGIHFPPQERAIISLGLNDRDSAITYLTKAFEERYAPLISLGVEPLYDSLHSDPRYVELLAKLSLNLAKRP